MIGRRTLVASAVCAVASLVGVRTNAQVHRFSFADYQPPTPAYAIAGNVFATKLKELSGGKMSVNQFPGTQLGQEPVMQQKVRSLPLYAVFLATIAFVVLLPDVVLALPKWLLPESVGCFKAPGGAGYICPP